MTRVSNETPRTILSVVSAADAENVGKPSTAVGLNLLNGTLEAVSASGTPLAAVSGTVQVVTGTVRAIYGFAGFMAGDEDGRRNLQGGLISVGAGIAAFIPVVGAYVNGSLAGTDLAQAGLSFFRES